MSTSRATGTLLRCLSATAGAAMRSSNKSINGAGPGTIVVGVESSSSSVLLLAGQQRRPHATSSWIKLFKPAQAFFGGGSSSGSAASTSAVSAAAAAASVSPPAAAAAAAAPPPPPHFGFAASASAARIPSKPPSSPSPPRKAAAASPPPAEKDAPAKKRRKGAPRGPSAYALFVKEHLSSGAARDGGRSVTQRFAAVAASWKSLSATEKSRFEAASKAAKSALPPREPKPAKALSGYQLFVREKLPTLRDESAAGGGAMSAMKAVAEAWRSAPAQVKSEFAARARSMGPQR